MPYLRNFIPNQANTLPFGGGVGAAPLPLSIFNPYGTPGTPGAPQSISTAAPTQAQLASSFQIPDYYRQPQPGFVGPSALSPQMQQYMTAHTAVPAPRVIMDHQSVQNNPYAGVMAFLAQQQAINNVMSHRGRANTMR